MFPSSFQCNKIFLNEQTATMWMIKPVLNSPSQCYNRYDSYRLENVIINNVASQLYCKCTKNAQIGYFKNNIQNDSLKAQRASKCSKVQTRFDESENWENILQPEEAFRRY